MSIRMAYTHWSRTYDSDRNLTRDLDQSVTREALADQCVGAILELGCGTGKNTEFLARIGRRVLALDLTAGMIGQARAKLRAAKHVHFAIADLTRPWPCAPDSADLIVCNLVLEHIDDLPFIFGQVWRALRPGGRFFLSELHPFKQYLGSKATFQHEDQQVQIPAFVHHVSSFLDAARGAGLALDRLGEWRHPEDIDQPPRLITFLFEKRGE